jgi:PAS domain S-box-containing protein
MYALNKKVKCWECFQCNEEECPVFKSKELNCWLIPETHCRNEIQGKFFEKLEMCIECEPFKANMDMDALEETLKVLNEQLTEFRQMVDERDRELESTSMELALGLSEVFEALKKISSGDPEVRMPETSQLELIAKLKNMVNRTAENLGEIVGLSHEFAIGLAEHFDVLHRVSQGKLTARVSGGSKVDLLEALTRVTNQMIESVSREITERKRAEKALRKAHSQLEKRVEERTAELVIANERLRDEVEERKWAEKALWASERQYRITLDSMGDAIHVVDAELRFVLINTTFEGWLKDSGLDTDVIGRTIFEAFPSLPQKVRNEYHKVLSSGKTLVTEEMTKLGGKEFMTRTRKIPVYTNGSVGQVVTVMSHITQPKNPKKKITAWFKKG